MKYKPSDIIDSRPSQNSQDPLMSPNHIYMGILGRCEYEQIAQKIVEVSQRRGAWTPLPLQSFIPILKSFASVRYETDNMMEGGLLYKLPDERIMLTEGAIERIVTKYPSSTNSLAIR